MNIPTIKVNKGDTSNNPTHNAEESSAKLDGIYVIVYFLFNRKMILSLNSYNVIPKNIIAPEKPKNKRNIAKQISPIVKTLVFFRVYLVIPIDIPKPPKK